MIRLEQKANEARKYDVKISDKKFIWTLLNNMKHHKYYKEIITLEDEMMHISRQRFHRESSRFVEPSNDNEQNKSTQELKIRCKYCYRVGHTDTSCRDKQDKRQPSMPQWAKHATCMKCKKKVHLVFNCPPTKYNCKVGKPPVNKNKSYNKKNSKTQKEESAALVKEFTSMVISTKMWNNTAVGPVVVPQLIK